MHHVLLGLIIAAAVCLTIWHFWCCAHEQGILEQPEKENEL